VGENASGKTSVLEGIAVAMGGLLNAMHAPGVRHIRDEDVRYVTEQVKGLPLVFPGAASVTAEGVVNDIAVGWERKREPSRGRTSQRTARQLAKVGTALANRVHAREPVDLPVLAYYGTQRVWLQKKATEAKRGVGRRFDGYTDALEPASNHRLLSEWMYQQTLAEVQTSTRLPHVNAVRNAVLRVIEGATALTFDIQRHELRIDFGGDRVVPFHYLSDGYRNMVAMTADIAWRAAVLNAHRGAAAPELSGGLVLIDEVELHLHPRWQRRVLPDLMAAFPKIQFVVTTHSPQVVASAKRGQVMILRDGGAVPAQFVEGRDSNSLLEDVFGEPYRPAPTQEDLKRLGRLIHEEKYDEARTMLAELEQRLGPDDPALVRARFELDLETVPERET
jgi:predicted ATP-binding protein involved in virulence